MAGRGAFWWLLMQDPNMRGVVFGIWSPDSKTVYFKAPFADGRSSFWAIPAEGGKPTARATSR